MTAKVGAKYGLPSNAGRVPSAPMTTNTRFSAGVFAWCLFTGCAAPAPPPAVEVPPAAKATAAPTAAPSVEEQAPPAEPQADPCEEARAAVEQARQRHDTMADCGRAAEAVFELQRCQQGAETDAETRSREAGGAYDDCADQVAMADYQKLVASLPAKEATRHQAVLKNLRGTVSDFCKRCDVVWSLQCVGNVFTWLDARALAAQTGALVIDAPKKAKGPAQPAKAKAPRGKGRDAFNGAYRDLARALCALPSSAWKDRKAPAGCEARVLASLRSELTFPQHPENPGHSLGATPCDLDEASP